ncbi:pentatricopeptide repeat-containing protein At5g46100 [Ziziphus jujuba]|uniref:Pentatricopeptide repeat-containing protein At5g46100 n=1 Tax=Ziziphus jujuba TaxID=326968 RepID=A0A6P3Z3T5_ZIZJJ|nr:pentatricopeptide repeat-containing protein At5g46100 [Ziziphus jujuba]XP_015870103.2 pentatricopeptide repeat-containing protein At5g46100 [Ziziphus jujuba]
MAVKLSSLTLSKRNPIWVSPSAWISSISCARTVENFPESNQDHPPNSSQFEQNVNILRNNLAPDNLIRVLDSTNDLSAAVKVFKWASLQKRFSHTADTYYRVILKLGLAGHVQEMEGFCQNMVKDKCIGGKEALAALVDTFVKHCRIDEAVLVLVSMNSGGYNPSIETFNSVMGAFVKEKRDLQEVLFIYKEIVKAGNLPTIDTLNYLLEALFETDHVESALDQFKRMNKKGCSPNSRSFEILIKGLIAKSRVDEAVSVLNEMFESRFQAEMSFFSCTIPLFCLENKPEVGIKLFRMMKDCNFVPDLLTYAVLVRCLCDNLWLDDVINLIEEMTEAGLTLHDKAYVDVINMFSRLGKFDQAIEFLEDNHVLETSAHNVLLEGCCSAGKLCMAKHLLEKMSERNIDDCDSWNILVRCVCEQEGSRKASQLIGRMVVLSFIPDCATYSALVTGNCKLSKYEDAVKLFYQIQAKCWVLNSVSYSKLIEGLCHVGRIVEAAEVFCYMSRKGYSLGSSLFNLLIKGVCSLGKVDEAIRLRRWACYSGTSCTSSTYTTIMIGLAKANKGKDLLLVLSQMLVEGCGLDLEAYCILILNMSLQNRIKYSVLLFNMMVEEGLIPKSEKLLEILSCIADQSQLCMISCSIDKLISNCEIMNPSIYNLLINGLLKEGNKHEACRLLDLMLEKGWVPDSKTHGLLIGSVVSGEPDSCALAYGNSIMQDTVSNILSEGLDKT